METILNSVIWRALKVLPASILRLLFKKKWMQEHIYIDIRPRHSSVEIYYPDNPKVRLYLEVRNNTHFKVVLDRLCLNFIYGIELAKLFHFKREVLNPGKGTLIVVDGNIDHNQAKKLPEYFQEDASHCYIEVLAECNSRLYNFSIEKNLDGIKPNILNKHLLEKAKID